jgi:hypothetical protein
VVTIVPASGATTLSPSLASTSWPWWTWPTRPAPKRLAASPKLYGPRTGKNAPRAAVCAGLETPLGAGAGLGAGGLGAGLGAGGLGVACLGAGPRLTGFLTTRDFDETAAYAVPPVPRVGTIAGGAAVPPGLSSACAALAGHASRASRIDAFAQLAVACTIPLLML